MSSRPAERRTIDFGMVMRAAAIVRTKSMASSFLRPAKGVPSTCTSMLIGTLSGCDGRLAKVDPAAMKLLKQYPLPGGNAGPYAVTVDGGGIVWVNEINTDTVVRFDPQTEQKRVVALPSSNVGIRKMVVDASGRLWYMGSHNGRLGVVE